MAVMTSIERMHATLNRKPVDRLAVSEGPWGAAIKRWTAEGHLREGEDIGEHFNMDLRSGGWLTSTADLDFKPVMIEETEDTALWLDGNGAKLRRHKKHDSTPEHVAFNVTDFESWKKHVRPFLTAPLDMRRIPFESYRQAKAFAKEKQRFFCWAGVAPFEQMHPVTGHENMLAGMALEPEWVSDMVDIFSTLTINCLEELFHKEGVPDGMFFYEDMGFKNKPFMSPDMYRDLVQPGHKRLFDFAHAKGCRVIVHSCGYVEPLVPGLIEAGMDCLQAMEVKAGMDLPTLYRRFGDKIAFFGGLDVRSLISNDRRKIDEEMDAKLIPVLKAGGSYIVHSDHSIPPEVDYDTLVYFLERGRNMLKQIK